MTAQVPDRIRYQGTDSPMVTHPLDSYFVGQPRPAFVSVMTCNYRGYVAEWKIRSEKLYLVSIGGLGCQETLDSLFPDNNGSVFAEWFTGDLKILVGEVTVDVFCYSSPEVLIVRVEKGIVRDSRLVPYKEAWPEVQLPNLPDNIVIIP